MNTIERPLLSSVRIVRDLTQEELAIRSGVSQAVISGLERGRLRLSETTSSSLAAALSAPTELIAQPAPATRVVARLQSSLPAHVRRRLEANLALAHFHVGELIDPALPAPPLPTLAGDSTDRATQLRHAWGVAAGPVENLVGLLEAQGVVCIVRDISSLHVGAVGSWNREGRQLVFVDREIEPRHQRLALAREIGFALGSETPEVFAAELLMPKEEVGWRSEAFTWSHVGSIAATWGVPESAVVNHARRAGKITATMQRRLVSEIRERGTTATLASPERPVMLTDAVRRRTLTGQSFAQVAESALLSPTELRQQFLAGPRGRKASTEVE